jgi:hypothetical protein
MVILTLVSAKKKMSATIVEALVGAVKGAVLDNFGTVKG